jgi:hypothetical protein
MKMNDVRLQNRPTTMAKRGAVAAPQFYGLLVARILIGLVGAACFLIALGGLGMAFYAASNAVWGGVFIGVGMFIGGLAVTGMAFFFGDLVRWMICIEENTRKSRRLR